MHLISRKTIREAAERFPRAAAELIDTAKAIEKGSFSTPEDLRKVFRSLDNHKDLARHYVIDIGHNEWRAVLKIDFVHQVVFVIGIFTHKEYDVFNARAKKGKIK
jgi:mRNA interferase HigB